MTATLYAIRKRVDEEENLETAWETSGKTQTVNLHLLPLIMTK